MKYRANDLYNVVCQKANYGNSISSIELASEGHVDAVSVLIHEMFELENTDLLDGAGRSILKGTEEERLIAKLHGYLGDESEEPCEDNVVLAVRDYKLHGEESEKVRELFEQIVRKVSEITGVDVRYALWLCDKPEDIVDCYEIDSPILCVSGYSEVDASGKEPVVLADYGKDGKLYGYSELPMEEERWVRVGRDRREWELQCESERCEEERDI